MWYGGVAKETLDLLALGDQVIARVRSLVPYGAGNQRVDFTRTGGEAGYRTKLAQQTYGNDWWRPARNAAATMKFKSGNCQDQAAVAYLCLRESLSTAHKVSFCVAHSTKHSFSTIGIPNVDSEDKVVVVDSWPIHAQAVLWKHHFCRHDTNLQVLRTKSGTKGVKDKVAPAAQKHYTSVNPDTALLMDLFTVAAKPTWDHPWCSMAKEKIIYESSLL